MDVQEEIYQDGRYLDKTGGTWHLEDAQIKARYVQALVESHGLRPQQVCEVGCGAGGVLASLAKAWPQTAFRGFDISPQAVALAQTLTSSRVSFELGDAFKDSRTFDLALILDVVEHVEDPFAFLRQCKRRARYKVFHIPLEISALSALRPAVLVRSWHDVGHIHPYSLEVARLSLKQTGHRILDSQLTPVWRQNTRRSLFHAGANALRRSIEPFSQRWASRLLGGYSLLVLAE